MYCYCHLIHNENGPIWAWQNSSVFRLMSILDDELVRQVGVDTNPPITSDTDQHYALIPHSDSDSDMASYADSDEAMSE